jgi:hypothetical protein
VPNVKVPASRTARFSEISGGTHLMLEAGVTITLPGGSGDASVDISAIGAGCFIDAPALWSAGASLTDPFPLRSVGETVHLRRDGGTWYLFP